MREILGRISGVFWAACIGVIALFVFFAAIGGFAPGDVVWLTILVCVLAVAFTVHAIRVRRQIAAGDPGLSRARQRMRERRGF